MKLLSGTSVRVITSYSLLLASLVQDVVGAPEPKASWVRKGKGRKAVLDAIRGKAEQKRSNFKPRSVCSETNATAITAPKSNVWAELQDKDAAAVVSWLFAQPEFNLTASENATDWDNTVLLVEAQPPNKTDALAYLDGNATAPPVYAHVVLDHRADENPYFQDILVGPLPIDNVTTTWQPLDYTWTRKTAGKVRNLEADEDLVNSEWLYPISKSIVDITLDLWNGTALGLDNDTLTIWGIDPLSQEDGRVIRWDTFWNYPTDDFDAETLLPLGLFFKSDVTGRDPSNWTLEGWLYNNIFYPTTDDFRAAYWSEGFQKLGANVEGDWARSDQQGPVLPMNTSYPPISLAPSGSRFSVDSQAKYVEWMDFSFYIGFSRDTGISLHDVRYKGDRILYELGLQEALAHYAGNDPVQSGTSYLDSWYGFGPYAFELVSGYDCPSYATYLNTSFYVSETTHTHINSICLFEYDADYPIQRHSTSNNYVSVTKNTYFTLRSVSTVGNYDYMFSFTFFMDGSMAVEVRASGYIQSAYYAHNGDYGYQIIRRRGRNWRRPLIGRVYYYLSGSMHDHVLNFKADFDILGTANTIQLMSQVPVTKYYPWSPNKPRNTMQLQRSFVTNECNSRFNWADNSLTQVLVVNQDEPNKYGELRGYRILPYTGVAHLTVENSTNLENAARWAEYDVQITRQKDSELSSAHPRNSQDVWDPPINFDKFFDGC